MFWIQDRIVSEIFFLSQYRAGNIFETIRTRAGNIFAA
jgi:hypothetical protein